MRFLAIMIGILLVVAGLFFYGVLPGLIGSRLAASLQESYGLDKEPEVEVSSSFPPKMLLGHVDRIGVNIDQLRREGILLQNVRMDLENVDFSLRDLLRGDVEQRVGRSSLVAEVPEESINEYLRENDLEGGEIDIRPRDVIYRSADAFFGLPASVVLDLRVLGPHTIEVIPQAAAIGGIPLPPFFTRSLASGGRTLDIGELPLDAGLTSVEPSSGDVLVVRAEK